MEGSRSGATYGAQAISGQGRHTRFRPERRRPGPEDRSQLRNRHQTMEPECSKALIDKARAELERFTSKILQPRTAQASIASTRRRRNLLLPAAPCAAFQRQSALDGAREKLSPATLLRAATNVPTPVGIISHSCWIAPGAMKNPARLR